MSEPTYTIKQSRGNISFALSVAVLVALGNFALWAWTFAPVSAPDVPAKVAGLSFTPFQRSDDPAQGRFPNDQDIESDIEKAAVLTSKIRTYTSAQFVQLPGIAARHNMDVTAGIWLTANPIDNIVELDAARDAAISNKNISRLIVGNETQLKGILTSAELTSYLKQVRASSLIPISTAEPWHIWLAQPELAEHVDFITIHLLPYWEGIDRVNAVGHAMFQLDAVRARFPNKEVVVGEVGWPSNGDAIGKARATPANQAAFIREFIAAAKPRDLDYFLMEANDQPWKVHEEGHAGAYWGVADAQRNRKFEFAGPIEQDLYWRVKAGTSSVAGFVLLVFCLSRLKAMRWIARFSFAIIAQLIIVGAVGLITQPLLAYMRATDWVALAIFVPTLTVMALILLSHVFEFAELFWEGSLRRKFKAQSLPMGQIEPFVSIHLACCNEPPAMVIATLASIHRLNYKNYEVLVIDNNTRDPALWQPLADYVATLPAAFQFFHLPSWLGFKAGALNFALSKSRADAEIIAVVDADYVVQPDWLSGLVGYFADPKVGVVQAPQAHRDWSSQIFRTMMNWEYDGFFRIGMHHRNERNAIVQHGTVSLISAKALRENGAWSEWCVCEDTELGLRLMHQGLTTVYVDNVVGRGLTPDSFAAFKKQRFRWAQGGMQILKAHANVLFGIQGQVHAQAVKPALKPKLSSGQRYHFLAGWLPWFGDALHLVFALAAIVFTICAIIFPISVTLPTALFMLPLATFVVAKLVIGPLLYWRRVPCSLSNILGASIAGMGVSHAIARGVIAGLVGKHARFVVTDKGQKPVLKQSLRSAVASWSCVTEEALMMVALLGVAALLAFMPPVGIEKLVNGAALTNRRLWIAMLCLQALPYVSALACVWLSRRPERKQSISQNTVSHTFN